ncbi:MAG: response regulator [Thiomargarita sp.]|nr:response regulator [Thiomargarita sp.]
MSSNSPLNILIVDDNKNNLFTLHTLIDEHIQANIFEADSGIIALQLLLQTKVDLIILDVQMPEMDGFETAKLIRSRKRTQHIPIVFLTAAYKSEDFQQKGFSIGAADYLTKPIDTAQLINRIKSYIRFIEQERQHNQELERKVKERTAELSKSNEQLTQEISEREQIERKLQEAHDQLEHRVEERTAELQESKTVAENARTVAEAANLSKSQFLANMSHELRTPLNAIIGYSEMLEEEAEDLEQEDFIPDLQRIHAAGKHLLGLINDVLDLSKIEAGKMGLHLEHFDLTEVFNEVVNTIKPLMNKKGNTLDVKNNQFSIEMYADITKLRQILLNLLSNSAKFTENGLVSIEVSEKITEDNNQWVQFCVTDDGIGMTEEQRNKLFQPFTQADSSTTRKYGGTGLGLAITKKFTEMMGGNISIISEFGHGTLFSILIPIIVAEIEMEEKPVENLLLKGDGIVLVIDTDGEIRELFKQYLSKLGYSVAVAVDGKEGLHLAKKLRPDALILDVNMPGFDGWEVLSEIKSDSLLADIPVIMMSFEELKERGFALGATDYLTKPIKQNQLAVILEKYRIGDDSTGLVMLVEDDTFIRETVAEMVKNVGWRVFKAENGQVALDHINNKQPALILLDLMMPVMNGFEFLSHLRQNEKWNQVPVVVLTSTHLTAEEQAKLQSNAVETIFQKQDYSRDDLLEYIHTLISDAKPAISNDE